ncbi:MAG TPA: glycoside hydrolase family 9 protein, partial [Streptosporangiaceae bacterium]
MKFPSRTTVATVGVTAVTAALLSVPGAATARITLTAPPMVRVNQVGYPETGSKTAFVMLPTPVHSVSFALEGPHGSVYMTGRSTDDLGFWSSRYKAVFELSFSRFEHPGTYRIAITGPVHAVSPGFRIASPQALYSRLVTNSVRFFTSERDGGDVSSSVLHRQPANLTDRSATVYADPSYDRNDNLLGKFHKVAGPVDVSGGWFDAGGGYEKFAFTASYTDALMLMAERDAPGRYPTLMPEAQFGLRWIGRLFDPVHKVMYAQVGIGNGNASNTIEGDYNFWFLPQREDHMGAKPGDHDYYVEYRPVFEAAPPGKPI